jgi:hypothetical protein
MDLLEPTREALQRLLALDPALWGIVWLSLKVSLLALIIVTPLAVGGGFLLAMSRFPGRRLLVVLLQSLLALPTVVVGLLLYLLLSRRGPLGDEVWCGWTVEPVRSRHPGQIDMPVVSTRRKQEGEYASSLHASQARYGLAGRPHPQQQSAAGTGVEPGGLDAGRRCLAQGPHT